MIIGALFSYDGGFEAKAYDKALVISTLINGHRLKRTIGLAELPAFIEHMEDHNLFYLDGEVKVELNEIQRGYFLKVLRKELERMEGSRRTPSSPCSEGPSAGSSARSWRTSSPT